jgi:hypothetical protein
MLMLCGVATAAAFFPPSSVKPTAAADVCANVTDQGVCTDPTTSAYHKKPWCIGAGEYNPCQVSSMACPVQQRSSARPPPWCLLLSSPPPGLTHMHAPSVVAFLTFFFARSPIWSGDLVFAASTPDQMPPAQPHRPQGTDLRCIQPSLGSYRHL